MNIHLRCKIALICFGLVAVLYANAEGPKKKIPAQTSAETALRLDKQASELMASRVTSSKVASDELAIAKLDEYNRHLEEENLLFPADELYNSNWDTLHVNPFQNLKIDYPDSYTIDCSLFVMPIDNNVKVTSKYGPRRRRMHRGIDLDLDTGDTVRAAFGGKVRIKSFERGGYGYYLVLRHPNGLETVYGHLSKFIARENQIVHAGQAIGLGGNTGNSRGSHLHFETRFLGKDINPAELIDFANGVPHNNKFEFHNVKINGKKSNVYSTSEDAVVVHRVRKGDNLGKIAIQYGTTVSELCRLNGISKTSMLSIGQPIRIIAKQIKVEASPEAVKRTTQEQQTNANKQSKTQPVANQAASKKIESPIAEAASDGTVYHYIAAGDTLYSLAKKYGTTVEKLCELNDIKENTIMSVGRKIRCS